VKPSGADVRKLEIACNRNRNEAVCRGSGPKVPGRIVSPAICGSVLLERAYVTISDTQLRESVTAGNEGRDHTIDETTVAELARSILAPAVNVVSNGQSTCRKAARSDKGKVLLTHHLRWRSSAR